MLELLRRVISEGLDINVPTQNGHKDRPWTKEIGPFQNSLRTGHTAAHPEIRALLQQSGFMWSQTLFRHLARRHETTVEDMPRTGAELCQTWISTFQQDHQLYVQRRNAMVVQESNSTSGAKVRFPYFGGKPLSEAQVRARYNRRKTR